MDVQGTTTTQSNAGAATAAAATKTMGKDDFLRLFTTQLKAQDPLNPMDSTAFTAQLAQFSSLEQLTNINTSLTNMTNSQNSLQNVMTTGMIGKQVQLTNDEVSTVNGILFADNKTLLSLENGMNVALGDIKSIIGGN